MHPSSKEIWAIFLLIITIITTTSTTGYITLLIIILANIKYIILSVKSILTRRLKWISSFATILLIILISVYLASSFDIINLTNNTLGKLTSEEYMGSTGWLNRLSLNKLEFLFTENRFHIFGISFETLQNEYPYAQIWNSILEDTVALGYFFSAILIVGYIKFARLYKQSSWLIIMIFFFGFSTEALFSSSFFLMFAFFGLLQKRRAL